MKVDKNKLPLIFTAFSNLRAFAKATNPQFNVQAMHIKKIAKALEDVEQGKIKRLMIFLPPRHGKTTLASEMFPAWFLGRNPDKSIIFTTYSQEFANNIGRKVRNIVASNEYKNIFPSTILSDDSSAASRFHTSKGGVYYAVGAGASITGRGAHILLIDDLIKNREEADSSLIRQKHKDWFSSVAYTRLEPNGAIVIIQTRWHNDDLSGWLLKEKKEDWTVISMPAITRDNEGMEYALWPERYPLSNLKEIQNTISSRDWSALYMQSPQEGSNQVFKEEHMQYYRENPSLSDLNVYIFVDPANSKEKYSDNTAIVVIGAGKDGNIYLLDAYVDKLNLKERENILFDLHEKYNPKTVFYEKYGMQLDIDYIKIAQETRNYRFHIEEVGGSLKKEDRIMRLLPYFEDKKIWFPLTLVKRNYLGRAIDLITYFKDEEFLPFPVGRHDDMIDAFSRLCDINIIYPKKNSINYYDLYK